MVFSKKVSAFTAASVATLALGSMLVSAAPAATDNDKWNPGNKTISGHSSSTSFSVPASTPVITVTCTNSVAGGHTPTTGLGAFKISPLPVFNDGTGHPCTDNLGGTETTVTSGTWMLAFIDKASDEASAEPNTGDKLQITVPKGGAVVSTSEGCTITVAPTAAFKVVGTYDDKNTLSVTLSNLPIKVTGGALCPTTATASSFAGTYKFTPNVGDAS